MKPQRQEGKEGKKTRTRPNAYEKIIERNVPIAEENVTLSGQPATNMFEDWSENITETDLLHEEKDKGLSPKKNPKKLMKEMDQIVQDDIKNIH